MKKTISVILTLILLITLAYPVKATGESTITATAPIAFIDDVDETGSNINDDRDPSPSTVISEIPLTITSKVNDTLLLSVIIEDQKISISGQPAGRSENQHAIYFTATSQNTNFEVVHMAYVDNAEVNMYFKNYASSVCAKQILQVYLRDCSSTTKDYIFIEIFDFEWTVFPQLIASLPQDHFLGFWVAREFSPKTTAYTDSQSRVSTKNNVRTYSVTFQYLPYEQTHTISIAFDCTYSDIPIGQTADIIYRFEIIGKSVDCPMDPTQNRSTTSFLHIDDLALRQITVPNVAFISESIDGLVQNNGAVGELSASISVGYGALSASLSFPINFTTFETVDIRPDYRSFVNGRNGNYTRSIKTSMANGFKLTQIGYYFEVRCTLGDFGNTAKSRAYHCAVWDITIINYGNKDLFEYSKTLHVPIGVV